MRNNMRSSLLGLSTYKLKWGRDSSDIWVSCVLEWLGWHRFSSITYQTDVCDFCLLNPTCAIYGSAKSILLAGLCWYG